MNDNGSRMQHLNGPDMTLVFARHLLSTVSKLYSGLRAMGIPAMFWPIILDLFISGEEGVKLSLSDVYLSTPIPKATVLRTLARLVTSGHVIRYPDPRDGRRSLVMLSDDARVAVGRLIDQHATQILPEMGRSSTR